MMAVRPSRKSSPVGDEVLEQVVLLAVAVERAGEGGAEAGEVRAAVDGVDVVDVGVDVLGVLVGVLQGDLDLRRRRARGLDVDDVGVDGFAGAVEVLDELDDAALVVEALALAGALVVEDDAHAAVQEGQLLQAACAGCCSRTWWSPKICRVGLEGGLGAALVGGCRCCVTAPVRLCRARTPAGRRGRRGRPRPRTIRRGS